MINSGEYKRFFTGVILTGWVLLFLLARGAGAASYPGGVTGAQPGWKEAKPAYPLAASLTGGTGMLRLLSPITPPKGSASVGVYTRFFISSGLIQGYNSRRLEGTGVFTYSITDYLETAVVTTGSGQQIENREIQPHQSYLAQTMGDFDLSVKAGYTADPALSIGAEARMRISTQVNDIGMLGDSLSGGGRFLFSFDFSEVQYEKVKRFPLRLLFNLGYFYDRSYNLAPAAQNQTAQQQAQFSQAAFNYALGIGTGGYLGWGLGVEFPQKYFTPFLEYYDELIYDRETKKFRSFTQSPQRITPGVRLNLLENLGIIVGVDISAGMNKAYTYSFRRTVEDIAAQPAPSWAAIVGINYQFGARDKCPGLGIITGRISDVENKLPLENAQIVFPEGAASSIITNNEGRYRTYQPEGIIKLSATKSGYFDQSGMALITRCKEMELNFELKTISKAGVITGRVIDKTNTPLAAVVTISSAVPGPVAPKREIKKEEGVAPRAATAPVVPPPARPGMAPLPTAPAPALTPLPPASIAPLPLAPKPETEGGVAPKAVTTPIAQPVVKPNVPAAPTPPAAQPKAKPVTKPRALLPGGKNMSNLLGQVLPPSAALRVGRIITGILLVGALEGGQVVAQEVKPPAPAPAQAEKAPAVPDQGNLSGVITSEEGQGLPAKITFDDPNISGVMADSKTGKYRVELAPGSYKIKVEAGGYETVEKKVNIKAGETTQVELKLKSLAKKKEKTEAPPEKGILLGTVTDPTGKALPATISFEDSQIPAIKADSKTGKYRVELAPDRYKIKVEAQGYEPADKKVKVKVGEETAEDFQLKQLAPAPVVEKGVLTGLVKNEAGKGLPAVIHFEDPAVPEIKVDPKTGGYYRTEIAPGKYKLTVMMQGYVQVESKVGVRAKEETRADFQLKAAVAAPGKGALLGTITDAAGKALPAVVTFDDPQIPALKTDPKTGKYRGELAPGKYKIKVEAQGYEPADKKVKVKVEEETAEDFQLKSLAPAAPEKAVLTGTVTDESGKMLAATISFDDPQIPALKTDPKTGKYRGEVKVGSYKVTVAAAGYQAGQGQVKVDKGKEVKADFKLKLVEVAKEFPKPATVPVVAPVIAPVIAPVVAKGVMTGLVTDAAGKVLAATVSFEDPLIPELKADPRTGKYRGEVKVGSYKVTVAAAGYQAGQGQVKVDEGKEVKADFKLKLVEVAKEFPKPATVPVVAPVIAKGVLLGTVTDATGKVLAATVSFDDPRVPALKADPKTGKYRGEVTLGKYKVKVEAVGYRLVEGKVEVKAKEEAQADFQLKLEIPADKGFLVGLVTDEAGKALSAVIRFDDSTVPEIKTDVKTGGYRREIAPGKYKVTVLAKDYEVFEDKVRVKGGEETLADFKLKLAPVLAKGVLLGTVTDATGKVLAATVSFDDPQVPALKTDPKTGKYRGEVAPGKYKVKVAAAGYELAEQKVKVEKREETQVDFQLKMTVALVSGPKPAPVKPPQAEKLERVVLATDPASGEFIRTLPAGRYRVEVEAAGFVKQARNVLIAEERETHLEIVLEPIKPPLGTLLGSVKMEKEKTPLAAIINFDQSKIPNLATDPASGNFMGSLPPGIYQATAFSQGFLPQTKQVEIKMGEDTRVDFLLSPTEVQVELGDLRGVVSDPQGKPVQAVVSFPGAEIPNAATDPENGKYFLKLPPGNYSVKAAASNFKSQTKNGIIVANKVTELNFVLEPLQLVRLTKKKIQILEKIHFEYDKSDILADSFPILDEVAQVLGDNPTIKLTIEGHTDIMGSHEYNMKLSQARVDSVRNYLISKGINQDRLLAVGYGATRPIADNATALGRAMNRRVEFVIQE